MAAPAIWWVRKDLRLGDNAALTEAAKLGISGRELSAMIDRWEEQR